MYQTVADAFDYNCGQPMRAQVPWLVAWIFCSAIRAASADSPLRLADCRLESAVAHGSVAARCGRYQVRENRDSGSKELALHVAVIPALSLKPAPDPLFILSGGPGQSASDFYLTVAPAFERIRRDRDLVLLDQRGTGRSNPLDCALPDDTEVTMRDPEKLPALARKCRASLPGDPRYYTTSVAVRDLDDVRAALGYDKVNLYGISYGTRVAQHYMRRYPGRVRTAILDGAVPADVALGPGAAIEAQHALDSALQRCVQDSQCSRRFPRIAAEFAALQDEVRQEPVTISIPHPLTGSMTTTRLDAPRLSAAIRLLSYSDETVSTLPLLIHEAHSLHQPQALAAQYLRVASAAEEQIAEGMQFAVVCSEDAPRWAREHVTDEALAQTYMGTMFMAGLRAVCEEWPRGLVDPDFDEPLHSAVQTLLLSGSNDPVTPQRYADRIMQGLRNARHVVAAGQGHGQLATGCIPRLMAEFVAAGAAAGLDTACVRNIRPAPFMLSRSAPAP